MPLHKQANNSARHSATGKSQFEIVYLQCPKHLLDLMPIQKGVGFNVATKKMTMDAQATVEDVKQKLMKTNTKYKEVVDIHCVAKVFKEGNKVMVLFHNKRFSGGIV